MSPSDEQYPGALYSATKVNIQSNVSINYVPYSNSSILPIIPTAGRSFGLIGSELNSLYENFGSVTDSAKAIFIINRVRSD